MAPPQPHGQSLLSYSISTSTYLLPPTQFPNHSKRALCIPRYIPTQLEDQPWQFPRFSEEKRMQNPSYRCRIPVTSCQRDVGKLSLPQYSSRLGANPAFHGHSRAPLGRHFLQTLFYFRSGSLAWIRTIALAQQDRDQAQSCGAHGAHGAHGTHDRAISVRRQPWDRHVRQSVRLASATSSSHPTSPHLALPRCRSLCSARGAPPSRPLVHHTFYDPHLSVHYILQSTLIQVQK